VAGPPGALIARLVQGVVMAVAQGDGELLGHLEPGQSEANVVCWCRSHRKAKSRWPATPVKSMSTLPHHVSDRARDDLRKVMSQIIDLAGDTIKFSI
jgi:hypothetical protein